jgi:hypothetical protein
VQVFSHEAPWFPTVISAALMGALQWDVGSKDADTCLNYAQLQGTKYKVSFTTSVQGREKSSGEDTSLTARHAQCYDIVEGNARMAT